MYVFHPPFHLQYTLQRAQQVYCGQDRMTALSHVEGSALSFLRQNIQGLPYLLFGDSKDQNLRGMQVHRVLFVQMGNRTQNLLYALNNAHDQHQQPQVRGHDLLKVQLLR